MTGAPVRLTPNSTLNDHNPLINCKALALNLARLSLRGRGEERLAKWIVTRLDQLKPRRANRFEQHPQQ
jgi:hypothetical protein